MGDWGKFKGDKDVKLIFKVVELKVFFEIDVFKKFVVKFKVEKVELVVVLVEVFVVDVEFVEVFVVDVE